MNTTDTTMSVEPAVREFKVPPGLTPSDADLFRLLDLIEMAASTEALTTK